MEEAKSLNRQLAELVGYHVEPNYDPDRLLTEWVLIDPQGESVEWLEPFGDDFSPCVSCESPAQAWSHGPDFEGSIDACSDLIPNDFQISIEPHYTDWKSPVSGFVAFIEAFSGTGSWQGVADTRPGALAVALFAYLQSK